jgi:hypothetical protein
LSASDVVRVTADERLEAAIHDLDEHEKLDGPAEVDGPVDAESSFE